MSKRSTPSSRPRSKPSSGLRGALLTETSEASVEHVVRDALQKVAGGGKLDQYFGVTSGRPLQTTAEAAATCDLVDELRDAIDDDDDAAPIVDRLSAVARSSGADTEALRNLMRLGRQRKAA